MTTRRKVSGGSRADDRRADDLGRGSSDAIITVRDLQVEYKTTLGKVSALNGVSFDVPRGSVLGVVGESGSGKSVTARAIMQILERAGRITDGSILFRRPTGRPTRAAGRRRGRDRVGPGQLGRGRHHRSEAHQRRHASHPRLGDRHDLPGADVLPQPRLHHRVPDPGGDPAAPEPGQEAVLGSGHRHAGPGRDAEPGPHRELLPARAVRRHAAAGHDRHGPVLSPRAADRRRADHGAGRDDRGPDPGSDAPAQGRDRHVDPVHHPQHGRRRPAVRRGDRDVPGSGGGTRVGGGHLLPPQAPVHPVAAALDPPDRRGRAHTAGGDQGLGPRSLYEGARVQLPSAVPRLHRRRVPDGDPAGDAAARGRSDTAYGAISTTTNVRWPARPRRLRDDRDEAACHARSGPNKTATTLRSLASRPRARCWRYAACRSTSPSRAGRCAA